MEILQDIDLVCIDFETVELLPNGSTVASADFWKPTFRVASCAFTWYDGDFRISKFVKGEKEVGEELARHQHKGMIVYNLQFEEGVVACRYPHLKLNWYVDVMRLAQLYDGGGGFEAFDMVLIDDEVTHDIDEENEETEKKPKYTKIALSGFGLSKASRRIIGRTEDHKAEAHAWIYANVPECKKGQAGKYLDRLPDDIMERYNIADTETTFDLYEFITTQFRVDEFDWTVDHTLYKASVSRIVESEIRGIPVNREGLQEFLDATVKEIADIGTNFRETYKNEIRQVEYRRIIDWILEPKTAKGRQKRLNTYYSGKGDAMLKATVFNPGSNKQLGLLFQGVLGIKPVFFTEKGAPSFKSSHLHQWSDAGKMLLARRKRILVQKQAEAILRQSTYDGRLHIRLKAVGTKTGRFSGVGGVNIQALSRREKNLMNKLLPDPGYIFVSSDMSAGEPTIITQLTKDPNYKYFCFDGIGKKPYYKGDILMIDDVYLGYASKCPMFAPAMRNIFDTMLFNGNSFADQWLINAEVIKEDKAVKFIRKNAKWMALAFGYGLGPKNVIPKAIEAGLAVKPSDGTGAFNAYWSTFNGIRSYAEQLASHTKHVGWFANHFGYRFVPEQPRKAFNGMIQSSVSSLFHWYFILMQHFMPEALFVCCVHDEGLFMIKEGDEDKFRIALKQVSDTMNSELNWDVDLRFGAVFGKDLYEAK